MEKNQDNKHFNNDDNSQEINFTNDNREIKKNKNEQHASPDGRLPEDDPALINPDELASFPREVKNDDPDLEEERDSHLVNRKTSSVREGRNITRTDTTPDNDGGFM